MNVTWQDGLVMETDDGDYRIQMGAFLRADGRFVPDGTAATVPNTFLMRTLRATFQGRITKYFTFRLQPDFTGTANSPVADAWADVGFSDAFHLRLGRDKVPIGMEVLLQDSNVVFLERGLTVNLLPQRDTGAQIWGDLPGGAVSYAGGLFNGQVDGAANSLNIVDTDNGKDLVGRIAYRPFNQPKTKAARAVERLTLAFGGSTGQQHGATLPSYKTSVQQTYFSYAKDAFGNGRRTHVAPEVSYYFKTFGGYAEWVRLREVVTRGTTTATVDSSAWQLVGSVLLTGETSGERIRPRHAFAPDKHLWGAFQLTARLGSLTVQDPAFSLALADPSSSRVAKVATLGLNWYMTTNVKMQFNGERSAFDHNAPGARQTEEAVLVRMQVNY